MNNPKVSIIIPLHNNERFIVETINSCLNQSYNNLELIVVENGSTDRSYELVADIRHPSIWLYQIDTLGAAKARNFGYSQSTGDLIMFLDADDILHPEKIKLQVEALENLENGWLVSCPWAKFTNQLSEAVVKKQAVWDVEDPIAWCVSVWTGGGMMILASWLIPRTLIESAGLWDETLSLHDDGEFMCRILLASKGNKLVENTLVYYRQVPNSLSKKRHSVTAATSALAVYQLYESHILRCQNSPQIRAALAYNYVRFIYEYYPNYQHLIDIANKRLDQLKVKPLPLVGSKKFKRLSQLIGFNRAIKFKSLLTS